MDITFKITYSLGDDREDEVCKRITRLITATQKRWEKENPYQTPLRHKNKGPDFDFRRLKRADGEKHLSVTICSHSIGLWVDGFKKDFQKDLRKLLHIVTGVKDPNVYLIKPEPKSEQLD
ncbi:hypothetical protein KC851_01245 [Candidatus Kaiserbacteria bacterium]|nr:hypothetical protein [Candidatus Kaiserbacteria bacterium]